MALKLGELVTYLKTDDGALVRGLRTAHEKLKEAGDKAGQYAPLIGGAIAAGIGAGLVGALDADQAKAKLTAQLGGSAQYAADMGAVAGRVYARGFGQSLEEVGNSLRGILTSGLIAEDATDAEIEALTVKAQALADVFGGDVTQLARAAGQMIRNGLAKNANEAFDILTRGYQQSGDHAEDLLDTVSEYSTKFRDLGLNGSTALGLLSQGLKAGARDADTVADALKEFSIRAIDGSKAASDAYKALGLDAEKMTAQIAKGGPSASAGLQTILDRLRAIQDPVKRNAAAVGLFGTKAEDLGQALFALDPKTAAMGLGKVAGAADKLGQTVEQSASQKLEAFKRQAQSALVDQLAKAIPYIERTFGWLQANSSWVTPLATALGILAAAIGVIVAVQAAWNAVLALSPVTWIVLGILAIVAGIVLLATKTQFFQTIWQGIWGFLKAVGAWFAGPFAGFFKATGSAIAGVFLWLWDKVKAYFGFWFGLFNTVKGWLGGLKDWAVQKFLQLVLFVASLPGKIKSAASGMWNGIKDSFKSAVNWLIDKWNSFELTIGGGSAFGVDMPSVTLRTPNIPRLATGGIVTGPTLAMVGEGRESEAVLPLSKLAALMGSSRTILELRSSGSRLADLLIEILRDAIDARGGNVQVALGTGRD